MSLTDRQYQMLRDQAIAVIRAVGVETGGSNVQFAVNPATDEIVVIEMNPRVSRSSALASKATGFPIAKIAARLAVGYTLDEIPNDITRRDAGLVRADDRLRRRQVAALRVREVPRRRRRLSTHMKSVGEVMAIGRTFKQAFAKAMRSRELDAAGRPRPATCSPRLETPGADRYDLLLEAFRAGRDRGRGRTRAPAIDPWFLRELRGAGARPGRAPRPACGPTAPSTPARPSSRPRRRTSTRRWERPPARARGRRAATGRA